MSNLSLPADSHLTPATRDRLFDAVTDLASKHNLPLQNLSGLPGVAEAGDVCGDVEKLVIIWLRALRVATLPDTETAGQ